MFDFDPRRLEKLAALRESGVEPYPNGQRVTHRLAELIAAGGDKDDVTLKADVTTEFCTAGRLRFKNEMGKAGFARIQDESGRIQIFVRKNDLGDEAFDAIWKKLDLGDWVWARGTLMRTRKGELSLRCTELQLYAKCIESLPDKHKGFTDPEQRQRMRYLDLFINEDTRETFRKRSMIVRGLRSYFDGQGFMEVETCREMLVSVNEFGQSHVLSRRDRTRRLRPLVFGREALGRVADCRNCRSRCRAASASRRQHASR